MAPRFDTEGLVLELSVADLLDPRLARSIGFAHRGGFERLWLGQAIHGRYQEGALAEDPTYRREVALRLELEHRGWRVVITGRADGLRKNADGARVVEEIKSVRREGQLSPAVRELYERQALLYAWMLAKLEPGPVEAELVLIAIGGEGVERLEVGVDLEAVETGVRKRLNQLLREHEAERSARDDRRRAGARAPLPPRRAAPRTGRDRRRRRAGARGGRAPAGRGAHRPRQDRRRALAGGPPRARARPPAVRADRQEPAAGDGVEGPAPARRGRRPARAAAARQGAHVRQRRGDLPRGLLRLRARLLRQGRQLGHRAAAAARGGRARPRPRLLGRRAGRGLPVRGLARSRRPLAGRGLRLQLRLRPLRRARPTSAPTPTCRRPSWSSTRSTTWSTAAAATSRPSSAPRPRGAPRSRPRTAARRCTGGSRPWRSRSPS